MSIVGVLEDVIMPDSLANQMTVQQVDGLIEGQQPGMLPILGEAEKQRIRDLSRTGLIRLVVEYAAQQLVVEGVRDSNGDNPSIFEPFVRNGMPSMQAALHASVLTYGTAYALVLPGDLARDWDPFHAFMHPFGIDQFGAVYEDPVLDEFPQWAWRRGQRAGVDSWMIWDSEFQYELRSDDAGGWFLVDEPIPHGMEVTPVVRFSNGRNLSGVASGEPLKYSQDVQRLGKTIEDRLRIQHYNSWRVKYAIKLSDDLTPEEEDKARLRLEQEDILLGVGDTEFGTLEQTDLGPMMAAQESDRDMLAAVTQTPVWAFNGGSMVNLSADALIEAKSGNRQKVWAMQRDLNRSYCNLLRLAARAEGRVGDADNYDLSISWADIGSLSMAAAADALGKLATQLGVPADQLWEMIPGVSFQKVQAWRESLGPSGADLGALVEARRGADTEGP